MVFYVVIFALVAVLAVVAGATVISRNRARWREDQAQQGERSRAQSRHGRGPRH